MSCTLGLYETLWKLKRDRTDGMLSPHEPVELVWFPPGGSHDPVAQGLTVKVGLLGADIDNLREVCPGDTVYVSDLSCGLEVQVQIFAVSKQDQKDVVFVDFFCVSLLWSWHTCWQCQGCQRLAGESEEIIQALCVCARVIFFVFNNQERKMQVPAQSKLVARRFGNQ